VSNGEDLSIPGQLITAVTDTRRDAGETWANNGRPPRFNDTKDYAYSRQSRATVNPFVCKVTRKPWAGE